MKKIIASLLILISVLSVFCACSKKDDKTPTKLDGLTSGYTGDVKIEQGVKIENLEIVLGKYIFTVNGVRFRYKDFEKTPKRTAQLGEFKMDLYVKDSALKKCILRKTNSIGRTVYCALFNPDGKAYDYYKYEYDDFGNITCRMHYDKDGKLESFFTAEYDEKTQNQSAKYLYDNRYRLKEVIKYTYNENSKLVSTAYYDAKGNLKKTA